MLISKIRVGKRFRKDIGELETLKNSIKEIGLLQPIVVDEKNNLIAGQRRLEVFKKLGKLEIPVNVVKIENALKGEYDENVVRKNFAPSESVAIWEAIEKAKGGRGKTVSETDKVSSKKLLGIHRDTLSKAKQVVKDGDKEIIKEMDETDNVNKAYQKVKEKERKQHIKKKAKELPKDKFQVIYCDPPWEYNNTGFSMSAEKQYPTMSIEKLKELNVKELADDDCIMFMWSTNPLLKEAIELMNFWGFDYKTNMVWIKEKHTAGFYVYGQHELLLIGVKGSMLPIGKKFKSIIKGANKVHSKKPEAVYKIIESMYPELKYIELFQREKRRGWEGWGNEN